MHIGNLFAATDPPREGERFETLVQCRNLLIERIVSSAEVTPTEYVQPQDEWVALLRGQATLEVAGERFELTPGDHLFLPAGAPHTVLRTSGDALWLAVHLR
jgi:cupin 2 domain-containing protein